jgi:hypothetical protein
MDHHCHRRRGRSWKRMVGALLRRQREEEVVVVEGRW